MIIVPEREIGKLLTAAECVPAVEKVFAAMASGAARNFPVVREALGHAEALYGFKSGFDRESLALGLKSGGFWPGNAAKGLTNHQSTIFLFDADTGRCRALVGGNDQPQHQQGRRNGGNADHGGERFEGVHDGLSIGRPCGGKGLYGRRAHLWEPNVARPIGPENHRHDGD